MRFYFFKPTSLFLLLISFPFFILASCLSRFVKPVNPRLVFGISPLINIKYWAESIKSKYVAKTFVFDFYKINKREDFDIVFLEAVNIPSTVKRIFSFYYCIFKFDIFVFSFDGFVLGNTFLARFEPLLFRIAGKKTIVWPYGSDAFSYRWVKDISAQICLNISYPLAAKEMKEIEKRVERWVSNSDFLLSGFMAPDGIGRWDVVIPNFLIIDTKKWKRIDPIPSKQNNSEVVVVHTPNHRGVKGTRFIIDSVDKLKSEGLNVRLVLIEGMSNNEVLRVLSTEADILVEQLILPGHGLSAIEGMSLGLPVISNLENDIYTLAYKRFSHFDQCPIVSSSPETILETLRTLVLNPGLRHDLGLRSREYVEKYHSYSYGEKVFDLAIRKIWFNENIDFFNRDTLG